MLPTTLVQRLACVAYVLCAFHRPGLAEPVFSNSGMSLKGPEFG
jgi:hypothetical protein